MFTLVAIPVGEPHLLPDPGDIGPRVEDLLQALLGQGLGADTNARAVARTMNPVQWAFVPCM